MSLGIGIKADKKLIILYLLSNMKLPLTRQQITNAVLENNIIDFFTFQQCISELEEAGMISKVLHQKTQCLQITEGGKNALNVFENRIPKSVIEIIDNYIACNKDSLKKESQVISEYRKVNENEYIVSLKAIENELVLIDLKLNVVSAKQAKLICEKWKSSSEKIYSRLIDSLIN